VFAASASLPAVVGVREWAVRLMVFLPRVSVFGVCGLGLGLGFGLLVVTPRPRESSSASLSLAD